MPTDKRDRERAVEYTMGDVERACAEYPSVRAWIDDGAVRPTVNTYELSRLADAFTAACEEARREAMESAARACIGADFNLLAPAVRHALAHAAEKIRALAKGTK